MSNFAEDTGVEIERDVVVVETEKASRERRSPLVALPLLLGAIFLVANVLVFFRVPTTFTTKNVYGSMSLLLLVASVVVSIVLIVYGLAARRADLTEPGERASFLQFFGVPVMLGLLAPLLTLWGLQVSKLNSERFERTYAKPCIEVYEKAAAIAKDNPRFRMLATDRDEVRCAVNSAIGR
jgi:hypothetical protein